MTSDWTRLIKSELLEATMVRRKRATNSKFYIIKDFGEWRRWSVSGTATTTYRHSQLRRPTPRLPMYIIMKFQFNSSKKQRHEQEQQQRGSSGSGTSRRRRRNSTRWCKAKKTEARAPTAMQTQYCIDHLRFSGTTWNTRQYICMRYFQCMAVIRIGILKKRKPFLRPQCNDRIVNAMEATTWKWLDDTANNNKVTWWCVVAVITSFRLE